MNVEIVVNRTDFNGIPSMFIASYKGDPDAGFAHVIHRDNTAFIMFIEVKDKFRRNKVGSTLIKAMQGKFEYLSSGWRSEAGKALLLKCGFKVEKLGKTEVLTWIKSEDDEVAGVTVVSEPQKNGGTDEGNGIQGCSEKK